MSDKKEEPLPVPVLPARGARAGVRSDVSRSKDGRYNPVGTGSAWSHNFLNQKPWHPLNFRNQIRKYEAEQKAITDHKTREQAMAEWQSEQERHATLALLSPEEAKRQKDRASISFMYQKPPGLEAALARDREREDKQQREAAAAAAAAAAGAGDGGDQQQQQLSAAGSKPPLPPSQQQQQQQQQEALRQRQQQLDRLREDPFAAILAARSALQQSEKFVVKSVEGVYGGTVPGSENQLLLDEDEQQQVAAASGDMDDAEALLASLDPDERQAVLAALSRKRRRADKAARLQQAQDLLRSAGIDPAEVDEQKKHKKRSKDKHKKHKKHKSKEKHIKHKKERRRHASSSSGSSSDDGRSSSDGGS